uniref:Uncharacterized protein n=1 Tax=Amorphochlora amoebiformis TaxID=1561963 RepID=A0A7S0H674_9EUKA|mmetsp:Transcript_5889/g.9020  ORF Transcript_5889/g.9020 Transcript_5889/m.9020 type:complete len:132 (+) Transcript_5889:22-417(+)
MTSEIKLVEGKFGGSGTLEEPSGDLATRGQSTQNYLDTPHEKSRRAEIEAHAQAVEQVRMRYYQLYKGFGAAFWAVLFVFCNYITIYYSFGTNHAPEDPTWYTTMTLIVMLLIILYLLHRFFDCLVHYGAL